VVRPQNADMPRVAVAFAPPSLSVPAVLTQDVPEDNAAALEQASLAGCANETKERKKLKKTNNTIPCKEMVCKFLFIGKDYNGSLIR
jgi:hypothetical protein